jgi:hypothetical protein
LATDENGGSLYHDRRRRCDRGGVRIGTLQINSGDLQAVTARNLPIPIFLQPRESIAGNEAIVYRLNS